MATDLLTRLTDEKLPALPTPREPSEPAEPSGREVEPRGRSPEEVVERWDRRPAEHYEPQEEAHEPQYQRQEVEAPARVEPQPQPPQPQQQTAQPPLQVTNLDIARVYDAVAQAIVNDLVANGLIEQDLTAAYPRAIATMAGQQRYAFDEIFQLKAKQELSIARLEQTITWLNAREARAEAQAIEKSFNQQLDRLAQREPSLHDQRTRNRFTQFLVERGATVEDACGAKAQQFLLKQWNAFNRNSPKNRFVQEGQSVSSSAMLERMIANSGRMRD